MTKLDNLIDTNLRLDKHLLEDEAVTIGILQTLTMSASQSTVGLDGHYFDRIGLKIELY